MVIWKVSLSLTVTSKEQYCLNRECVFRSTCKRKTRKASLSSILFSPQQRSATQHPWQWHCQLSVCSLCSLSTHTHTYTLQRYTDVLETLSSGEVKLLLELTTALITITIKFCGLITHIALPARTKVIFSTLTSTFGLFYTATALLQG